MKRSISWLKIALIITALSTSAVVTAEDHQDYMENPELEAEAQMHEANSAPKVSYQELPYYEEETQQPEYETEYKEYESP